LHVNSSDEPFNTYWLQLLYVLL